MFYKPANHLEKQALNMPEYINACECSEMLCEIFRANAHISPYWTQKGNSLIQLLPAEWRGIASLQNFTASRISEVAFLSFRMVAKTKVLKIEALKGSFDREIELPQFSAEEIWKLSTSRAKILFGGYDNYCNAIQSAIKRGNLPSFEESKTDSHIFRHYFGEEHFETVRDIERLQKLLGHQKPESTLSYIKKSV
jgi:integrase